jgi:hypothetical protein
MLAGGFDPASHAIPLRVRSGTGCRRS